MSADSTLLPANATAWERANSTVSERMLAAPVSLILRERDPANCDAGFVAPLAWERSVHYWSPSDDAGNRARIASSFVDHCGYGAPAALEAEVALDTGLSIAVREFWEVPGLVWPDFVVLVNFDPSAAPAQPDMDAVVASALRRKPVRDVLDHVGILAVQPPASEFVGAGSGVVCYAKILPGVPPQPQVFTGAASGVRMTAKILPLGKAA